MEDKLDRCHTACRDDSGQKGRRERGEPLDLTPKMNWIQLVSISLSLRTKTPTPPMEATMASITATYPIGTVHGNSDTEDSVTNHRKTRLRDFGV